MMTVFRGLQEERKLCGADQSSVGTYLSLQVADQHPIQNLPGFVAVAYVLEGFGRVLAADVEEDFFTASVCALAFLCSLCGLALS